MSTIRCRSAQLFQTLNRHPPFHHPEPDPSARRPGPETPAAIVPCYSMRSSPPSCPSRTGRPTSIALPIQPVIRHVHSSARRSGRCDGALRLRRGLIVRFRNPRRSGPRTPLNSTGLTAGRVVRHPIHDAAHRREASVRDAEIDARSGLSPLYSPARVGLGGEHPKAAGVFISPL